MAVFTYQQLQTKVQNWNQVQGTLQQMSQWLNQYQQFLLNNWSLPVPSGVSAINMTSTMQTMYQSQWETMVASLNSAITNLTS